MSKGVEQKTVLYLIRHGATEANLARPARIQGRRHNPPLARLGVRQAEATRDFLAIRPIDHCYCSPLLRAVQTAAIVAATARAVAAAARGADRVRRRPMGGTRLADHPLA